jgi:3-dehydroquinate synthase
MRSARFFLLHSETQIAQTKVAKPLLFIRCLTVKGWDILIKLNVNLKERSYPIYLAADFAAIGKCALKERINGKIAVITDTNVDRYQSHDCISALQEHGCDVHKYTFEAGEKNKTLDTVKDIYKFLAGLKLDRSSTLVALGGGVVGDITGFAAATFLRGIKFVQVPTSLLAQADSSVGGKVGVDFEGGKNLIGAFYQPKFVYINVSTLKTLPKRELVSGLAEIIKHGLIFDKDFFNYVDYNLDKILKLDQDVLIYIAKINCSIKAGVVEKDERESGLRAILNFGHTIGHAVESVSGFELLHGECVSIGIVGAYKIAKYLEMVDEETVDRVVTTLKKAGLPVYVSGIDVEQVYNQMFADKKIKRNKLHFILPKKIGEVTECVIDDEKLIKKVISELNI